MSTTTDTEIDIVEAVLKERFDDTALFDAYAAFEGGNQNEIQDAMGALIRQLQEKRSRLLNHEWQEYARFCLMHPIKDILLQDPFTRHSHERPRGYAGDAELLDYIYGIDERFESLSHRIRERLDDSTEVGRQIFGFTSRSPAPRGVCERAEVVAGLTDNFAGECAHKPRLLSVAAGHFREGVLSESLANGNVEEWVAFDGDPQSLEEVNDFYEGKGYPIETVAGTVRQLLRPQDELGQFDFIYSNGLFDYLKQSTGQRLVKRLFEMLRPGGIVMVSNFLPDIDDVGYMETFMRWDLIYRTHPQMVDLAMTIDQRKIRDMRLLAEDNQNIVFLQVRKK